MSDISHLLDTFQKDDPGATEQLFVLVYSELRRLAAVKMSREAPGQTLQPTALVHEAWLRLGGDGQRWENRARHPEEIIHKAVWGMIPKNRLGKQLITKLKVYKGTEHPHAAQQPATLKINN